MTEEDQVREMIYRWSLADADKDVEGFAAVFTEDGKYWNKNAEWKGPEALRKNIADRIAKSPPDRSTMHLFAEGIVKVDGDQATLVSPYVAYGRVGERPWEIMSIGRFHCELVKQQGHWLFTDMENRSIGPSGGPASGVGTNR